MQKKALLIGDEKGCEGIQAILSQISIPTESAHTAAAAKKRLQSGDIACALFDEDSFPSLDDPKRIELLKALKSSKKDFIILTSASSTGIVDEALDLGAADIIFKPYNLREFFLRFNACYYKKTKIACIGGGTGLFNLLMGAKTLPRVLVSSIVGMTDDGGSTGRLRESFGMLPPGDVRRNLVALSNAPTLMNEVLQHRFKKGGESLEGHNFGNLFLAVLSEICGSMKEGVKSLGDILNIQGIVIPVTTTQTKLHAMFEDGTVIAGESRIDIAEGRHPDFHIKKLWHDPEAECNIDAYAAILFSDAVIIGPGDLFTSVITNLVVEHIREAIAKTKAKKVYICNLMTKPGETSKYDAIDHVKEIVSYLNGDHLDYVIISNTKYSRESLARYEARTQYPVVPGNLKRLKGMTKAKAVIADVGHETDLVRHDGEKLKRTIAKTLGIAVS